MNFQPYILQKINEESPDVRTFFFTLQDGGVPDYKPGHFFLMRLNDPATGKPIQRAYSVASHPDEPMLSFCIKLKGVFTHMLWGLKGGERVELDGPYGIFLLDPADTERVFIGGGVGISALRSMILQTVRHDGKRAWLFHSGRGFENLTYFSQMRALASESPLFRFYPSITGEEKPAGWNGWTGRINVARIKETLGSLADKTFYFCGSKEMGAEISAGLTAEGVPKEKIKKDEWG
ncbi:MAG: FAD-dependent oxidoreductase [Candidatus Micrarchaeota archaeon]|nr:FAD-dependent oxidoreductase [Candidatus Micrarchaeota archaeon]